jgi:hypothetical protein
MYSWIVRQQRSKVDVKVADIPSVDRGTEES